MDQGTSALFATPRPYQLLGEGILPARTTLLSTHVLKDYVSLPVEEAWQFGLKSHLSLTITKKLKTKQNICLKNKNNHKKPVTKKPETRYSQSYKNK